MRNTGNLNVDLAADIAAVEHQSAQELLLREVVEAHEAAHCGAEVECLGKWLGALGTRSAWSILS